MTNQEAQNLIARNRSVFQFDPEMLEALDLALEALKTVDQAHNVIIEDLCSTCYRGDTCSVSTKHLPLERVLKCALYKEEKNNEEG